MHISSLSLRDFRSWHDLSVALNPGVTLFVGRNGYGKTNIVEAVGYAAHLASHRVSNDAPLVRAGMKSARISATAVNQGRELTAHILINAHGANQAQINRTRLKSPREVLGVVRSVLFAPEDLALVRGEPAGRRAYMDAIIATRTPRLAGVKADYEKVLRQRTALLKKGWRALRQGYDSADGASALSTLDVWDAQLARLGAQLVAARLELVAELGEFVHAAYSGIAPESRPAHIAYKSSTPLSPEVAGAEHPDPQLIEALLLLELAAVREQEIDRGQSLRGPHRDDLELYLGDHPAKGFASHGETWSYAIALRLAEFQLLRQLGTDPILVLDDVFAELDAKRREKLVALAGEVEQVLITAAVGDDLPGNLNDLIAARHTVTVDDTQPGGRVSLLDAGESAGTLAPAETQTTVSEEGEA